MHPEVPFTFNPNFFREASYYPTNCKLIVPAGTRDAYIAAGWTEDVFKGGVVEAAGEDDGEITWGANMTGNTSSEEYVDIMVSGGDVEIELSSTTPNGKETFDVSVVGTHLQFCVYAKPDKVIQLFFNGDEYTDLLQDAGTENGLKLYKIEGNTLSQFFTSGTWVVEFKKQGVTWNLIAAGEVPDDCSADIGMDGMSLEITVDKNTSQESQTYYDNPMGYSVSAIVSCPAGYTYKLWFNGIDYSSRFTEDNGYTIDDEEELRSLVTDGTWVVEFKKESITWNLKVIGEIPEGGYVDLYLDGQTYEVYARPNDSYLTDVIEPWPDGYYPFGGQIIVPNGYTFTLLCNGEDISTDFAYNEANSWYSMSLAAAQSARFNADINWVIAFRKINNFDVNCDGQVSIADVTKLVNKILGKE